jgi:uncharacterized protein YwqG
MGPAVVPLAVGSTTPWDRKRRIPGDGSVGNFYIRRNDLARRDFSKVMYYWDFG